MYTHRKKSEGLKSGDLGGHMIGPILPVHLPGNCCLRKTFTGLA
jgi:hypothetical protein